MTDRYTRTFADFENHPWPGKILPEYFEHIPDAGGGGNPGLQRMTQGALSAYGPYHVIEGCEYQSPGVPTEWTGSVGYVMYSGLIRSVEAASGALSADGSYLIYNSDGKWAVTGGNPTGVILAKNIGGTVYTVNTRYDSGSSFYLPQDLLVYGGTYLKNNLTASGTINLTGTITYIGDSTQSGYTYQTGNVYHSGHTDHIGYTYQTGNVYHSGYTYQTGNVYHSGHTDHIGDVSGAFEYSISGYETITTTTGQFKHLIGFSTVNIDADLQFNENFDIFGVVQLTGNLVRVNTAGGLTVGTHTLSNNEWAQLAKIGDATNISSAEWGHVAGMQAVGIDAEVVFDTLTLDAGDLNGLTVGAVTLTTSEWTQLGNIGANVIAAADWANLAASQPFAAGNSPTFLGLNLSADLITSSTIDGVDIKGHTHAAAGDNGGKVNHTELNSIGSHSHTQISTHINSSTTPHVSAAEKTSWGSAVTHISQDGSSHAHINQAVKTSSDVSFNKVTTSVIEKNSDLTIGTTNANDVWIKINNVARWLWDGQGDFYPSADNTYDFGYVDKAPKRGYIHALYTNSHTTTFSHVDDLQLLREAEESEEEKVWKKESLPWIKARDDLKGKRGKELNFATTHGEELGYMFSTMKKMLERQDDLVNGIAARDLMIEDLQTRLGIIEGN